MLKLGVKYGVRELLSTVQAVCLLTVVLAEPFYQRRDHLDQTRYLSAHNDNVVKDRNDAEVSLLDEYTCSSLEHCFHRIFVLIFVFVG